MRPDVAFTIRLSASRLLAGIVLALGVIISLGWVLDIQFLKNPFNSVATMKGATALGLVFAGVALLCSASRKKWDLERLDQDVLPTGRAVAVGCGLAMAILGAMALVEHATDIDLGINWMLLWNVDVITATTNPGRVSIPTSLCLLLLGFAFVLSGNGSRRIVAKALTGTAAMLACLSLVGQMYGLTFSGVLAPFSYMAAHTTLAIVLLCGGMALVPRPVDMDRPAPRERHGIMFGAALLCMVLVGGGVISMVYRFMEVRHLQVRMESLKGKLLALDVMLLDAETSTRGFVLTLDEAFLEPYEGVSLHVDKALADVRQLSAGMATDLFQRGELEALATQKIAYMTKVVELARAGNVESAIWEIQTGEGERLMAELRSMVAAMMMECDYVLNERVGLSDPDGRRAALFIVTGLVVAMVLFWIVFLAFKEEVKERKRSEEEALESASTLMSTLDVLRKTQYELVREARLNAYSEMVAGFAHEFNNSLIPLLGGVNFLISHPDLMDNDREEVMLLLKEMDEAARGARDTIRRLRSFYRSGSPTTIKQIHVPELIADVVAMTEADWKHRKLTENRKISLKTDLAEVPLVECQETALRSLLANMLENSVDAIEKEGTICISTAIAGDYVELKVADTGAGMTEEVKRRCFEPFFTTKGQNGVGLGLSLCGNIVERHGWRMTVESEPGKGTTFTVRLPQKMAPSL